MSDDFGKLFQDLDLEELRVVRPSKFAFLCGGALGTKGQRSGNLRDYICRVRPMRLEHPVVLAEAANQLYRDTSYNDLITFEEDIARIAAIVVVTAESSGALAELGAFVSNETIRPSLRILLQERYEKEESFVRFGPIERVSKEDRSRIGVFPWRTRKNGGLITHSVAPHYVEIKKFLNDQLNAVPSSMRFNQLGSTRLFYAVYWAIFISYAVSTSILYQRVRLIEPSATDSEIRNKIFCMRLAGWVEKIAYSGKDYFFTCFDDDPFDYAFLKGVAGNDSVRRKMALRPSLEAIETVPNHVKNKVRENRDSARRRAWILK